MSRTLIWDDLEESINAPVCNREEVVKLEDSTIVNNNLTLVRLSSDANEHLLKVFDFKEPASLHSSDASQLVITNCKKRDIDSFIKDKTLLSIRDVVYLIVSTINKEISAIRCHKAAEEKLFGARFKSNYEKDEKLLALAVKQYCDCSLDDGTLAASIMSISFTFSHDSKPIKVTNNLLLRNIMDCIRECYNFEGPPISYDFETLETSFKQLTAKGLFDFFQVPGTSWHIKKKVNTHRVIAEIFKLADVKIGNSEEEVIETWLKRIKPKE